MGGSQEKQSDNSCMSKASNMWTTQWWYCGKTLKFWTSIGAPLEPIVGQWKKFNRLFFYKMKRWRYTYRKQVFVRGVCKVGIICFNVERNRWIENK